LVESVAAVVFPAIMRMVISLLYARCVLFELERRKVGKKRALASWQAIQQGKTQRQSMSFFSFGRGRAIVCHNNHWKFCIFGSKTERAIIHWRLGFFLFSSSFALCAQRRGHALSQMFWSVVSVHVMYLLSTVGERECLSGFDLGLLMQLIK
jgi:hypothetical protein